MLCRNAIALWNHDQFTLSPQFNCYDPLITQLVLLLQSEFEQNLDGRQGYLDSLINMLAVHLLSTYSTPAGDDLNRLGALPQMKLTMVLHYIQEHLDQKLELETLAALADLSQYHFSRAFKHSTGFSPHQYIIQQRVFQAQSLLTQQTMSIGEVAIACGFSNQSHLKRHFKRITGMTPKKFQATPQKCIKNSSFVED